MQKWRQDYMMDNTPGFKNVSIIQCGWSLANSRGHGSGLAQTFAI